ncbi:MAG: hypothetical protein AAF990_25105, partial [Bacteroidota bacterium]
FSGAAGDLVVAAKLLVIWSIRKSTSVHQLPDHRSPNHKITDHQAAGQSPITKSQSRRPITKPPITDNKTTQMNIRIATEVQGNYRDVIQRFDRQLFEALAPKNAKIEIVEFTGSKKGDRVHIRFLSPLKAEWVSLITEDGVNDKEAYFVDEGVQLPFGLSYWRHRHIVEKVTANTSRIIDDITFKGPNFIFSLFMYPGIFMGFYPRKKIYRAYFGA